MARLSLAYKIFGLAILIVTMMVGVTIHTNLEVQQLGLNIRELTTRNLPIAASAADLNEAGLRRRIAFERLFREYGEPSPNLETVAEAEKNFNLYTTKVTDLIAKMHQLLVVRFDSEEEVELATQAREVMAQIEAAWGPATEQAREVLLLRKQKDHALADRFLSILEKQQKTLQDQREKLQEVGDQLAMTSARESAEREKRVFWGSIITTAFALLVGLMVAGYIARELVRPIRDLLLKTNLVTSGDLSVRAVPSSMDEVGQLGESFNEMVVDLGKKQAFQQAIGTYIDPRIVEKIILPGRPEDGAGQKRVMTIMFTDLVNFTALGENLTASGLVHVINRYFTLMAECVKKEDGIIDKLIGDCLMAYWGPPFVKEGEAAERACRAAVAQLEAMNRFQKELPELMGLRRNVPQVAVRVGISTGEVVVGNIGSETARSYTVMGDVVNLASRLEAANKVYQTKILISEETARGADKVVELREVDALAVKGKVEPVNVYEVIGIAGQVSTEWTERRQVFAQGLESYRKQEWTQALGTFGKLVEGYADGPAKMMRERVEHFQKNPPGVGWDGVWRLASK